MMIPKFDLNPQQEKAVSAPHGPLLVLAGAGSGKTRILTCRIARLISQGVPSFNILGVTFTNKAADEMKSRVARLVSQQVWISTFHSTCMKILRIDGQAMGLAKNFSIYDDYDQLVLIKECLSELNKNERQINPKGIREEIQRAKDYLLTPEMYQERSEDSFQDVAAQCYALYEKKLAALKACDFGDLIFKTVFLFDHHPNVLESWQERFKHILIDEYQDTNHAQYRLVRLLAERYKNVTVVGDPDQSIYAWRGADIRNILDFEKDYSNCTVIKLEQNYRSTANILDASNHLIEFNTARKPKSLWTEKKAGDKISVYQAVDERDEAQFVVNEILNHQQSGRTLADCVVFYRLHAQSRVLEEALRRHKVPYRIFGGIRFYDRKEIKDLIAYLRLVAFPHDDLSFKRVVNVPNRGIGKKTIETIEAYCAAIRAGWDQALRQVDQIPGLSIKARGGLKQFYRMVQFLRTEKTKFSLSELLDEILKESGYVKDLELERTIEAKVRLDNIQEFFSAVQEFEESQETKEGILESFIESIALTTPLDDWDGGSNSLTMMSLHAAKGLEFPIVFMVGMEEEIFPHINSFGGGTDELEEERRLCYVGMTRAKEKLYFVYADARRLYGSRQHHLPSRFLNEMPCDILEQTAAYLASSDSNEEVCLDHDELETKRRILFD